MLIENLYTLNRFEIQLDKLVAEILINAQHKIFEGHFPQQPVLPGVCQIQIVKELLEKGVAKKLFLFEAGQFKFLQMIDPDKTPTLIVTIDYTFQEETIACNASIKNNEQVFLKMSANFRVLAHGSTTS